MTLKKLAPWMLCAFCNELGSLLYWFTHDPWKWVLTGGFVASVLGLIDEVRDLQRQSEVFHRLRRR
jgi:hypothetical protein